MNLFAQCLPSSSVSQRVIARRMAFQSKQCGYGRVNGFFLSYFLPPEAQTDTDVKRADIFVNTNSRSCKLMHAIFLSPQLTALSEALELCCLPHWSCSNWGSSVMSGPRVPVCARLHFYLRIENAEGNVLIAMYLFIYSFIYLFVCVLFA